MVKKKNGKNLTTKAEKKQLISLDRKITKARTIRDRAWDQINTLQDRKSTITQRAKKRKTGKALSLSRIKSKRKGWHRPGTGYDSSWL